MATFKRNYLPSQSQPWAKEVETKIDATERNLKTLDVNNRSKDEQFAASLSRLDTAARNAAIAAEDASIAAQDAADAAATAQAAIDGLGSLDEATSTYKINAANLTVGSLSGDRISGGEIVGTTLKTASSGRRVEIQSTQSAYYDQYNNYTGKLIAEGTDRAGTLQMFGPGTGRLGVWSGGVYMSATGGVEASVDSGGLSINSSISLSNGNLTTNNGNVTVGNGQVSTNGCTMGSSNISASGTVSGGTVSASNFSGTYNTTIAGNTTSSFAGNVFINTSGNMFRSTATSSREAKDNIQPYTFDTDAFISVSPVTFNYKPDAVSDQEETQISQLGFILEDFEDAGVGEYLTIPTNEMDKYKGLRYDKLYMLLHKVVQEQNETIKTLTARIEALEAK